MTDLKVSVTASIGMQARHPMPRAETRASRPYR
jgi:hypothetical protein